MTVRVKSINPFVISMALGVTNGLKFVGFEIVVPVPVVDVQIKESASSIVVPTTATLVSSSQIGACGVTTTTVGESTKVTTIEVTSSAVHGSRATAVNVKVTDPVAKSSVPGV